MTGKGESLQENSRLPGDEVSVEGQIGAAVERSPQRNAILTAILTATTMDNRAMRWTQAK